MSDHGAVFPSGGTKMAPDTINPTLKEQFTVGGVEMKRPFRIRRLGHFGVDIADPQAGRRFYEQLLGFRVSDELDMGGRIPAEQKEAVGPTKGYFSRHGTDHHSFVWFPRKARQALLPEYKEFPESTVNQITWQVGSLREVVEGLAYMRKHDVRIRRSGRDTPGSNWHFYPFDPEGHTNEFYYGIEQIGWDGCSKPAAMHKISYHQPPDLPHRSEYAEVTPELDQSVDPRTGWRAKEWLDEKYDVGGVLLARPFKVVRIGPVRLFVKDMERVTAFYRDRGDRGGDVARPSLRVPALQHRASFDGALSDRAARRAGLAAGFDLDGVRHAGRRLRAAQGRGEFPEARGRDDKIPAARTLPRHRLQRLRARSRRARDPALLLHGAGRLGRQAAPGIAAPQDRQRELARDGAGAARHVPRRSVPRAAGLGTARAFFVTLGLDPRVHRDGWPDHARP
jgi:catechol 2,3-dioxygenase-like lactoylglutathione lyase family enzyme